MAENLIKFTNHALINIMSSLGLNAKYSSIDGATQTLILVLEDRKRQILEMEY